MAIKGIICTYFVHEWPVAVLSETHRMIYIATCQIGILRLWAIEMTLENTEVSIY